MAKKKSDESYYQLVHDHKYWHYQCVVYQDSAPDNWIDICRTWGITVLISPYHDSDILPDGSKKKPHYHVILVGDTSHYYNWAIRLFREINGVFMDPDQYEESNPKSNFANKTFWDDNIVHQRRYAIRYLTHKDDADKHKYDDKDVTVIGCFDYDLEISMSSEKYTALAEIEQWCYDNKITQYYLLSNYARQNNLSWYKVLVDGGHNHMYRWLRSFEYDLKMFGDIDR